MSTMISKAEFDALPDSLKAKFKPEGDNFSMEEEDVTGLKAKRDELLAENRRIKDAQAESATKLAAYETEKSKLEDEKLTKKGEWDALRERMEAKHASEIESLKKEVLTRDERSAERDLQLKLISSGVREDRAEDLAIVLKNKHIKPVSENGHIIWRSLDDTETVDLDKYIPGLKESKADYFKAAGASGSGASQSQSKQGEAEQGSAVGFDRMVNAYAANGSSE